MLADLERRRQSLETGPFGPLNYTPTVSVSVESGDDSLAAAARRRLRYLQSTSIPGVPRTIVSRRTIRLPLGRAVRIVSRTPPPSGTDVVPSQPVEYVVMIDESTFSIGGTAPIADHRFVPTMESIADAVVRS